MAGINSGFIKSIVMVLSLSTVFGSEVAYGANGACCDGFQCTDDVAEELCDENAWFADSVCAELSCSDKLGKIYWSGGLNRKINRMNLDGSDAVTLIEGFGDGRFNDLEIDFRNRLLIWSDYFGSDVNITSLDNLYTEVLTSELNKVSSIELDIDTCRMFMSTKNNDNNNDIFIYQNNQLNEINYNGLYMGDLNLDAFNQKLYWTEYVSGIVRKLMRMDLNSFEVVEINVGEPIDPECLAIDPLNHKLYFGGTNTIDQTAGTIRRCNLDGSNLETLITNIYTPEDIAIDAISGKMYWVHGGMTFRRANLDGTNIEDILNRVPFINNNNFTLDLTPCSIADGNQIDCNRNNILDDCEIAKGYEVVCFDSPPAENCDFAFNSGACCDGVTCLDGVFETECNTLGGGLVFGEFCEGAAEDIFCGETIEVDNSTVNNTPSTSYSCGIENNHDGTLWYRFVASGSEATLTTCNSVA